MISDFISSLVIDKKRKSERLPQDESVNVVVVVVVGAGYYLGHKDSHMDTGLAGCWASADEKQGLI